MSNKLYYGDNLTILREHQPDSSVDLIYLDPPFNSESNYNIFFTSPGGAQATAQIEAFEDTWTWGAHAEQDYDEVLHQPNTHVSQLVVAMRQFLGESDMMAYITMMANRLLELHRVLKSTGSLYLHCDPAASHYLKILLDSIFGGECFRNEIVWRRTGAHNSARRYGPIHDTILFYTKSKQYTWNKEFGPYLNGHVETYFKQIDERGRYWSNALTGAGTRNGESGKAWRGFNPTEKGRHWAIPSSLAEELGIETLPLLEKLEAMYQAGCINLPKGDGMPEYRQYLSLSKGIQLQDIWAYQPHTSGMVFGTTDCIDQDVRWLNKRGDAERLGYPTQKPVALLERIVRASSNPGDVVLDPFCGCGTAVHAAQRLGRKWIGIDITHLAISLIEKRLKDSFDGISFTVEGTPKDLDGAADLMARDPYQFQWWALSLVNAMPYAGKKKGADGGIDGLIYFQPAPKVTEQIIVSVKGGGVSVPMVRELIQVVSKNKAAIGLLICLNSPTKPMIKEAVADGYYVNSHTGDKFPKLQILTVEGLLDGSQKPSFPDLSQGSINFKKAPKNMKSQSQNILL